MNPKSSKRNKDDITWWWYELREPISWPLNCSSSSSNCPLVPATRAAITASLLRILSFTLAILCSAPKSLSFTQAAPQLTVLTGCDGWQPVPTQDTHSRLSLVTSRNTDYSLAEADNLQLPPGRYMCTLPLSWKFIFYANILYALSTYCNSTPCLFSWYLNCHNISSF